MRYQTLLVLTLLALYGAGRAADWPNWRGPQHNGISTETGWKSVWPAAGPKRLWKVGVGTGFASVAVSQGRVLTIGNADDTDTVFCLDVRSGDILWKHSYPQKLAAKYYEGGPNATPTAEGGRVFTFSKSGLVQCLEAASGELVWKKDLAAALGLKEPTWGFAGSPLVRGDQVILNAGESGVALDKQTGDVRWRSGQGPAGYSTPVPLPAGDRSGVALMGKDALIAVNTADGSVWWRYPWETQHDVNAADPLVIGGDRYFITSGYNHGCALVKVTDDKPGLVWENKKLRSHMASPVLSGDQLYGVDDNQLVCLELNTGEVRWTERSVGKGSLMIGDGKLIVLSEKGELMVAEPSPTAFKVISRAQVLGGRCWTVPVLANGRIYCRNAAGDLVCLDVSAK